MPHVVSVLASPYIVRLNRVFQSTRLITERKKQRGEFSLVRIFLSAPLMQIALPIVMIVPVQGSTSVTPLSRRRRIKTEVKCEPQTHRLRQGNVPFLVRTYNANERLGDRMERNLNGELEGSSLSATHSRLDPHTPSSNSPKTTSKSLTALIS